MWNKSRVCFPWRGLSLRFQWELCSWICMMMLCRFSFTLQFPKKSDKLIIGAHISIKMWFLCGIKLAFQTLSNEWQNLIGSNKTNLVLILRNPLFFLEVFRRLRLSGALLSSMTFVLVEEVSTVMYNVIQIVIRLFRILNSALLSLSSNSVGVRLISGHPSILPLSPGLRCTYHQQHLVIFNYDLSSDQMLMGLEVEERRGSLGRSTSLLSASPPSSTTVLFSFFPAFAATY